MHRSTMRNTLSRPSGLARPSARPNEPHLLPNETVNTAFTFGKLGYQDIRTDVHKLSGYQLSNEELKAPTPEIVKRLVGMFMHEILLVDPDRLSQPVFGCMDVLEYPMLYDDDTIAGIGLLRHARKLFDIAKYGQFGVRDIYGPNRVNFQWQLSALANLYRFRTNKLAQFEEKVATSDAAVLEEKKLLEDVAREKQRIAELQQKRAEEEPELKKVKDRISELGVFLGKQHEQQRTTTDKTAELKKAFKARSESVVAKRLTVAELREEVENLSAKVVSSPNRVKSELEAMRTKLESEQERVSALHRRNMEFVVGGEALKECIANMLLLNKSNASCVEKMKIQKENEENLEVAKKKETELATELSFAKEKTEILKRQTASLATKIARVKEQYEEVALHSNAREREREGKVQELQALFDEKHRLRANKKEAIESLQNQYIARMESLVDKTRRVRSRYLILREKLDSFQRDTSRIADISYNSNMKHLQEYEQLIGSEGCKLSEES